MKFDDSDKDYFLHDFSAEANRQQDSESAQGSAAQQTANGNPQFSFTDNTDGNCAEKPRKRRSRRWLWFFVIIFVLLGLTLYVRYFVPYATESRATGYVTLVEKRGIIFPTFEGEMVSESLLNDTSRIYTRDIYFSIPSDSLALRFQKYQGSGQQVTVTFKRYYGILPWRGASNTILTSFELSGE